MNATQTNENEISFEISDYLQTIIIFMYAIITIIAIGGNGVVCYLVYAYKRMHTVPNYFIVNLACSDIIMAVFCIPFTSVANLLNYWPFGETMCPTVSYIQMVAVFLSAYTLVSMSVDRYIVIVHPFKRRITTKQTVFVICGIWVFSLAIPLPTVIQSRMEYFSNTSGQCLESWDDNSKKYAYSLGIMILHYFGPLAILMFSYCRIGYSIWMKNIHGDQKTKRRLQLAGAKRKMVKMMITVVIFYALCWLPLHAITLLGDNNPEIYNNKYIPIIWMCCHWLAMSNSCYNPMIYLWMSPKFRAGLQLAIHGCTRRRPRSCDSDENIQEQMERRGILFKVNTQRQRVHRGNIHRTRRECQLQIERFLSGEYKLPGSMHSDT